MVFKGTKLKVFKLEVADALIHGGKKKKEEKMMCTVPSDASKE